MEYELEEKAENLKKGEELVTTTRIKKTDKSPPYIVVGNGMSTKDFPEGVVMDAFKVFSELTKVQQGLFVDLKDILVKKRVLDSHSKIAPENPNLIWVDNHDSDEFQQSIRTRMGQNLNGTKLEEKGIMKKIKSGKYMLNPYLFPPANDFERTAKIWEELPTKT